jgi:hypothetical protein
VCGTICLASYENFKRPLTEFAQGPDFTGTAWLWVPHIKLHVNLSQFTNTSHDIEDKLIRKMSDLPAGPRLESFKKGLAA